MNLKLRQFRELAELTQKQFAKMIGKSTGTIQSWERGDSWPNAEAIWNMCVYFNTDPNTFLGWYDEHPREEAPPLTNDESEMVECYRASTSERKRLLMLTARDSAAMSKDAAERGAPVAEGVREAM